MKKKLDIKYEYKFRGELFTLGGDAVKSEEREPAVLSWRSLLKLHSPSAANRATAIYLLCPSLTS